MNPAELGLSDGVVIGLLFAALYGGLIALTWLIYPNRERERARQYAKANQHSVAVDRADDGHGRTGHGRGVPPSEGHDDNDRLSDNHLAGYHHHHGWADDNIAVHHNHGSTYFHDHDHDGEHNPTCLDNDCPHHESDIRNSGAVLRREAGGTSEHRGDYRTR